MSSDMLIFQHLFFVPPLSNFLGKLQALTDYAFVILFTTLWQAGRNILYDDIWFLLAAVFLSVHSLSLSSSSSTALKITQ